MRYLLSTSDTNNRQYQQWAALLPTLQAANFKGNERQPNLFNSHIICILILNFLDVSWPSLSACMSPRGILNPFKGIHTNIQMGVGVKPLLHTLLDLSHSPPHHFPLSWTGSILESFSSLLRTENFYSHYSTEVSKFGNWTSTRGLEDI